MPPRSHKPPKARKTGSRTSKPKSPKASLAKKKKQPVKDNKKKSPKTSSPPRKAPKTKSSGLSAQSSSQLVRTGRPSTKERLALRLKESKSQSNSQKALPNNPRLEKEIKVQKKIVEIKKGWTQQGWLLGDWEKLPRISRKDKIIIGRVKNKLKFLSETDKGGFNAQEELQRVVKETKKQYEKQFLFMEGTLGEERWYFPDNTWKFLNKLTEEHRLNSLFSEFVLGTLQGKYDSFIDCTKPYLVWRQYHLGEKESSKIRLKTLSRLKRSYESLNDRISIDPILLPIFKKIWGVQFTRINRSLTDLKDSVLEEERFTKENLGLSVGLDKDLSKQKFWTPVVTKLVEVWKNCGFSNNKAFNEIAHLLSLAFPNVADPNQPTFTPRQIKLRFYHASKNPPK